MIDRITSTLAFKSNIQPVSTKIIMEDKRFLGHVRDPFCLEILYRSQRYTLTSIQAKEFKNASMHCAYAFKDDYPWGTIITEEGKEKVVCKCINTECIHFKSCRPHFDSLELETLRENESYVSRITESLNLVSNETKETKIGDEENNGDLTAASVLFAPKDVETVTENTTTEETENVPETGTEIIEDPVVITDIADATFSSFVSVEQSKIIELNAVQRSIINAGPGTGKTWTLIEKIKYMLNTGVEAENILVLCFSRAAVEVIRNRLEAAAEKDELPLNWHLIDVRTFDSFATYMLAWLQENIPELLPSGYSLEGQNYEQRIRTATKILQTEKDMLEEYEHIIVDEVQDLVGSRAEMVLALLSGLPDTCGFTLLGDSCQALYDYLAVKDENVMSSDAFYKTIFHQFRTGNFFKLEKNYRQGDEFGQMTIPYREAILSEIQENRISSATALNNHLNSSDINLQHVSKKDIDKYTKNGTVGILTRTNGQALQISAWLRTEGIKHQLQKPINSMDLAAWVANVLLLAETDVIDFEEFDSIFSSLYPGYAPKAFRYWEALLSTQRDESKAHYEIEDLLKGLLQNSRHPLLFEEPVKASDAITVSNIHRAKGREFDSVLVIEDVIAGMTEPENDDLLEHKVCYVALTRPKKLVEKVFLKPQFIYISKDENRKCFRSGGFANKKYLSHYEIGDSTDLNVRSFGRSAEVQDILRNKLTDGTRLKLLKCPKETQMYVTYKIVLEEDTNCVLGYTSWDFAIGMERAIQRIYNNHHSIDYKYFPNIFGDIYFNGLTTCVSALDKSIEGARQFGGMFIWNGISLSGFAQMEKDRY